jgi:hypothetical protein
MILPDNFCWKKLGGNCKKPVQSYNVKPITYNLLRNLELTGFNNSSGLIAELVDVEAAEIIII